MDKNSVPVPDEIVVGSMYMTHEGKWFVRNEDGTVSPYEECKDTELTLPTRALRCHNHMKQLRYIFRTKDIGVFRAYCEEAEAKRQLILKQIPFSMYLYFQSLRVIDLFEYEEDGEHVLDISLSYDASYVQEDEIEKLWDSFLPSHE